MRVSTWSVASLVVGAALVWAVGCQSSSENAGSSPVGVGGSAGATAVACQGNEDCAADERCLPDGTCAECAFHSDCQDGLCIEGSCVARKSCAADADCLASAPLCVNDECVECLTNEHCEAGKACVYGACRAVSCEGGECGTCTSDSECPLSEHCERGHCAADFCDAGKSRCISPSAVVYCDGRGAYENALPCPDEQGCGGELGAELCKAWTCIPGATSCDEAGTSARTCAPDGQGYSAVEDCGKNDQVCATGACHDVVCEKNSYFCQDGNVQHCNDTGTASSLNVTCSTAQYCDEGTATCKFKICTPGAAGCDGDQKGVCNELGSAYEDLVACKVTEACVLGDCLPKICTPNEFTCGEDGNAYRCNSTGTMQDLWAGCDESTYCQATATNAGCYYDVCTANSISCSENTTQQCNTAGSGYIAGTDCAALGQACFGGVCQPTVCTVGTRLCVNGDVHSCTNNGTNTALYTDCTTAQYCDGVTATCKTKVCTPGAPGCVGSVATTCKADGSGWEAGGTDCTATGDACDAGVCKDIICTPNGFTCNGATVELCNGLGTAKSSYSNCGTSTAHCYEPVAGNAYCRTDICTQGGPACNGTVATTCNADGSAYVAGGTDCTASGDACEAGVCKDIVCTPSSKFCSSGSVQQCNALGTAFTQYDFCFSTEFCQTLSAMNAQCSLDVCSANQPGCQLENYGTCTADGSAYVNTTDCSATGQVCSTTGCAGTATDVFGGTTSSNTILPNSQAIVGNIVRADVDRTLTSITQMVHTTTTSEQFVIYKSSTLNGPYTPIFDTIGSGTGPWRTSGPISVQLEAGQYYFIGYWTSYMFTYVPYSTDDPPIAGTLGAVVGMYWAHASGAPPSSFSNPMTTASAYIQLQTLVTAPPL